MSRSVKRTFTMLLWPALLAGVALTAGAARADTWRGTAPFCDGSCNAGEVVVATSNCGDGACCWTGHKVLCRNQSPTCQALQTNTSCYGIIQICDNGHYEITQPGFTTTWVSCSKYACGLCIGLPF